MSAANMTPAELGRFGEDLTEKYYSEQGYEIIDRNRREGRDEIDIIAKDVTSVVFVEVKTRTEAEGMHRPAMAVNTNKRACLIRAARAYMRKHPSPLFHRFDVMEIVVSADGTYKMNYIRNAFDANGRVI